MSISNKRSALIVLFAAAVALLVAGCGHDEKPDADITISPDAGTSYKTGDKVAVKVNYGSIKPDSVVYLLDSVRFSSAKDSAAVTLKTDTMLVGPRIITARVYQGGKAQEASTNIVLLPKAPEEYTFKIEKTFPHDVNCFTEGLLYHNGFIYESAGGYLEPPAGQEVTPGGSSLRKVNLNTGKVLQKAVVGPKVFAEGIAIVDDKIIQLTYLEKIGYVYDKTTFKLLKTFTNEIGIEGWGLCFDGKKLYMDDKTNRIFFLDKNDYHQIGYIDVYDDKGPVNEVNELEYINGILYANVWQTDKIIAIDPKTGAVLQRIDLTNLYPKNQRNKGADVLNGIAYDAQTKRTFITGKKWDKLFQVAFVKK